ncbi:MAG TPA: DNA recombination protein RmuC [Candidatus Angelobacter sp.]|nr:DNA recombination protein RmuC [Candidatus Angelobacter sp.]
MEPTYVVLIAIGAAAFVALLVAILVRQGAPTTTSGNTTARLAAIEGELVALREAKAEAERKLAVEVERASRIAGLEQAVAEKTQQANGLIQAKGAIETDLATRKEGLTRVEASLEETKGRLMAAEKGRDDIGREKAQLESIIAEKSALLSEKTEALVQTRERLDQASTDLDVAQRDATTMREKLATLQETLDQERKQAGEKLALLTDAKELMTQEFKVLADDVMKLHAENFTKQNKEQIDTILLPLREKIVEFQQGLQSAHTESAKDRAALGEQIRQLTDSSTKMTTETSNLARALKGETQTRGAWGEMILETILERSGLREGEEYTVQENFTTEDGKRRRPDVVINLPGGQRIIVDSKLSLNAFEELVNAEDDEVRSGALARHLDSMRSNIKGLASKEYHVVAGSHIDYVIMFVPIEGALAAALQEDPSLTNFAVENSVAIATPTTLMIALRTIANVWQVERRNRNAEVIAERAGKLYDKMVGFVEDMTGLGNRLNQARDEYEKAMGKLSTGGGNLIRQAELLKNLGAKTTKSLPTQLMDGDDMEALPAPAAATANA